MIALQAAAERPSAGCRGRGAAATTPEVARSLLQIPSGGALWGRGLSWRGPVCSPALQRIRPSPEAALPGVGAGLGSRPPQPPAFRRQRAAYVRADARARSRCPAGTLPSRCGPRLCLVDAAATLPTRAARKGAGRSPGTCQGRRRWQLPAHARPLPGAWNAEGRAPAFARARLRWPRLPRLRSLSEPLRRVRASSLADPSSRFSGLQAPSPRPLRSQPSPSSPRGMGLVVLGVARPGPGSRSVSRCQRLPGSRRLALSLSQWRRRLR